MSRYSPEDDSYGMSSIPDRSRSDYYCETCDSHMNSAQMWESHITGKRHIKNTKKAPSEPPSKIKTIVLENAEPYLDKILRNVEEPIVGLSFVTELQRADPEIHPSYTCYLCHGNFTKSTVVSHLISTKHRLKFLKAVESEAYTLIDNLSISKSNVDQLTEEEVAKWEAQYGRGNVEVKMEKSKSQQLYEYRKYQDRSWKYVDLDDPSTSRANESYPDTTLEEPKSSIVDLSSGIDRLNLWYDYRMLPLNMKMKLVNTLIVTEPLKLETVEQVKMYYEIIKNLYRCGISSAVRYELDEKDLQHVLRELIYPDPKDRMPELNVKKASKTSK